MTQLTVTDVIQRARHAINVHSKPRTEPAGTHRTDEISLGAFKVKVEYPDTRLFLYHRDQLVASAHLGDGWQQGENIYPEPRDWKPSDDWLSSFAEHFPSLPPKPKATKGPLLY